MLIPSALVSAAFTDNGITFSKIVIFDPYVTWSIVEISLMKVTEPSLNYLVWIQMNWNSWMQRNAGRHWKRLGWIQMNVISKKRRKEQWERYTSH